MELLREQYEIDGVNAATETSRGLQVLGKTMLDGMKEVINHNDLHATDAEYVSRRLHVSHPGLETGHQMAAWLIRHTPTHAVKLCTQIIEWKNNTETEITPVRFRAMYFEDQADIATIPELSLKLDPKDQLLLVRQVHHTVNTVLRHNGVDATAINY